MYKVVVIVACAAFSAALHSHAQLQKPIPPAKPQATAPTTPPQPAPEVKTDPTAPVKPAPPTPIAEKKAELGDDNTWNPEWDKLIEQSVPTDLLSNKREHGVKSLCPRFNQIADVDKRAFWAYFFQALAGAEAGLKPTANVRHTDPEVAVPDTVTHRIVRQEGLLQLTYMDGTRYGCAFDWNADKTLPEHDPAKTILQPKNNLLCGIRILDNQLLVQHKPLLSKSSYWVTLRPGTMSYTMFIKQMANEPAACRAVNARKHHPTAMPSSDATNNQPTTKPAATAASTAAAH